MIQAKYVHTNLIAYDWRALADFYQRLLGCVPVPPERDYRGDQLDARQAFAVRMCVARICVCQVTERTDPHSKSTSMIHASRASNQK